LSLPMSEAVSLVSRDPVVWRFDSVGIWFSLVMLLR
jgi:hypothetical protein